MSDEPFDEHVKYDPSAVPPWAPSGGFEPFRSKKERAKDEQRRQEQDQENRDAE